MNIQARVEVLLMQPLHENSLLAIMTLIHSLYLSSELLPPSELPSHSVGLSASPLAVGGVNLQEKPNLTEGEAGSRLDPLLRSSITRAK
ncbi:hypothetical protein PIB30_047046 [Stylosanthes scabra]|uniref:Uncharacterized protein n=1 Tax=Stylosanthes scabra TaxID=79078 RepID=A0ABU6SH92_9FABA|nr:hypothetical protein [Stylosanthes scabra]